MSEPNLLDDERVKEIHDLYERGKVLQAQFDEAIRQRDEARALLSQTADALRLSPSAWDDAISSTFEEENRNGD
jgi:hypothetical protein